MTVGNLGPSDDLDALVATPVPPPATHPPATQPPATQPPATQPPAASQPATQPLPGVGEWFQPLAGGLLPVEHDVDGAPGALLVGQDGRGLHAPTRGTVDVADPGGDLVLATREGLRIRLAPEAPVEWTATPGDEVAPGQLVGRFPGSSPPGTGVRVIVTADGPDGEPVDARDLLVGLADPAELGTALPGDSVLGSLDPFEDDLRLARRERRRDG